MNSRPKSGRALALVAALIALGGQACPPDDSQMMPAGMPIPGPAGLDCWDLNGNGEGDDDEDLNGDGNFDALDCQGAPGIDGASPFQLVDENAVFATGNVGIGTDAPQNPLHVVGTISADAFTSNSPLQLQTNGVTRIFADDATGNVSIGTDAPTDALQVVGTISADALNVTETTSTDTLDVSGTATAGALDVSGTATAGALDVSGTASAAAFSSPGPLHLQTSGATRIFVDDANGEVGIGTNNPGATVHAAQEGLARFLVQSLDDNTASVRLANSSITQGGELWLDTAGNSLNLKMIVAGGSLNLKAPNNQGISLDPVGNVTVTQDLLLGGKIGINSGADPLSDIVIASQNGNAATPVIRLGTVPLVNDPHAGIIMFDEGMSFAASTSPDIYCGIALHHSGQSNNLRFVGACAAATNVDNGKLIMSLSRAGFVGIAAEPVNGIELTVDGDVNITGTLTAVTKNFAHPHPTDPTLQINYVCLEGPENGTYFRGSGRLVNGRAEINVPDHFRFVTKSEGLTVQITPMGRADVWVESKGLERIVVKGTADVEFDYLVNGLRQGFDTHQPIVANTLYRPRVRGEAFGRKLPPGVREILQNNGTLNADNTPNEALADALDWPLADKPESAVTAAQKNQPDADGTVHR